MTKEKSGYNLTVAFTPDAGTTINFDAKTKTPPGIKGTGKIDINTDGSPALMEFAPGAQKELTEATLTAIYDMDLFDTLNTNIQVVGSFALTSGYTGKTKTIGNAWISEVVPGSVDLNGNPTMDVKFEFGGGATGAPAVV